MWIVTRVTPVTPNEFLSDTGASFVNQRTVPVIVVKVNIVRPGDCLNYFIRFSWLCQKKVVSLQQKTIQAYHDNP